MRAKELAKVLSEKGLTPEQILKIVERYERQKERAKQYQKEKYYKVSITVEKELVQRISSATGIPENKVKKYLAGVKALRSLTQEEKEKIKEVIRQDL